MEIDRQKKAEVLQRTVKHIDITAHDPRALIDAYKEMSFSARAGTRVRRSMSACCRTNAAPSS